MGRHSNMHRFVNPVRGQTMDREEGEKREKKKKKRVKGRVKKECNERRLDERGFRRADTSHDSIYQWCTRSIQEVDR